MVSTTLPVVLSREETLRWMRATAQTIAEQIPPDCLRRERAFLSAYRVYAFWGARFDALLDEEGEGFVCVAATLEARRATKYGRYLNSLALYTLPFYRRQGYATRLQRQIEEAAAARGYLRVKARAAVWPGVRLHRRLGHTLVGVTATGELQVDGALAGTDDQGGPRSPLNDNKTLAIVTDDSGIYRVSREEALAWLLMTARPDRSATSIS